MSKQDKAAHPDPEKLGAWKSYLYARDIIKGPWKEAEEVIRTDARVATFYARFTLKGRWEEAEEVIKTDDWAACMYAVYVRRKPWPEAEEIIMSHPCLAEEYDEFIKGYEQEKNAK